MNPGNRKGAVIAAMAVEMSWFVCRNVGLEMCIRSAAMRLMAELSRMTCAEGRIGGVYRAVGVLVHPLHCKERVVRLHDNVADLVRVWKDRKGCNQLAPKAVSQPLHEQRSKSRARPTGNRVAKQEALYGAVWEQSTSRLSLLSASRSSMSMIPSCTVHPCA